MEYITISLCLFSILNKGVIDHISSSQHKDSLVKKEDHGNPLCNFKVSHKEIVVNVHTSDEHQSDKKNLEGPASIMEHRSHSVL